MPTAAFPRPSRRHPCRVRRCVDATKRSHVRDQLSHPETADVETAGSVLPTDPAGQADVTVHEGHALGVDGAEILEPEASMKGPRQGQPCMHEGIRSSDSTETCVGRVLSRTASSKRPTRYAYSASNHPLSRSKTRSGLHDGKGRAVQRLNIPRWPPEWRAGHWLQNAHVEHRRVAVRSEQPRSRSTSPSMAYLGNARSP